LALFSIASVPVTNADTFLNNGVTAHRGNSGEFPENTMPAFESAIEVGADWLELDIFKTKDDKLVVIHDRTTKRVGDEDLDVAGSTYDELLTVDVATEFRRKHNLTAEQCPKRTAPLLQEVLRLVMTQNRTRVSIQPKMDCVAEAVALVKRLKCERWVGFNDGDLALMSKVKQLAPELPVFWDRGESNINADIAIANQHGFEALVLNQKAVTKAKVDKIHAARLEAGVWVVNDEHAMKQQLTSGIDRIYTDYPRRLLAIMEKVHGAKKLGTNWPQWRGPAANGVADGGDLPIHWSTTENILWSAKLPGWGTSSPVVYGSRMFVTSEVDENGEKSLLTLCFDRTTGRELWRHDFGLGANQRTHEKSNLAVNTPAVTRDAVYVAFGNAEVARYSHEGELAWVTRYMDIFDDPKMAWGYCLSPVVLEDSILFPWDHHTGPCFLVGLSKQTGEIAWKKERPIGTAHATPLVVDHQGQRIILVPGKNRLTALDAKTHEELWRYGEGSGEYNGEIIVSPVYGDGMAFLQLWRQSRIHAVRLNAGDAPTQLWVSDRPGPLEPSLLYYKGLLYAWMDNGVLVCFDGKTGSEQYRKRLGGNCNSSPIASDGRVFVSNNDGTTFVVQGGPKFRLLAQNSLSERITASPAISGDRLLIRTDSQLFCIGK
jgi:glycerophosphoryl diester phosphodiesterase